MPTPSPILAPRKSQTLPNPLQAMIPCSLNHYENATKFLMPFEDEGRPPVRLTLFFLLLIKLHIIKNTVRNIDETMLLLSACRDNKDDDDDENGDDKFFIWIEN